MDKFSHNINHYIFDSDFYYAAHLFIMNFNELPSRTEMFGIDFPRACIMIEKEFQGKIMQSLQCSNINASNRKEEREQGVYILEGRIVLELGHSYCHILYCPASDKDLISLLKSKIVALKRKERRKPLEINLIAQNKNGLYLEGLEVKRTRLDVALYYNDDFKLVDEMIRKRLNKKADKGIVLLHGIPGTGKTTYLRHLVGKIKKRVLFVPPDIAARISNPELVKLLVDYPESVLVIEDAENIIMQRQPGNESSVSNLLNISDGLLSDFLNVQVICTFNSSISSVDDALLRKGRLIARYEFGKLTAHKAQHLSAHLGFDTRIDRPMTLAEITNQHEQLSVEPERHLIGFRRMAVSTK
jgi:hypothetical protein